jgi:hypothetical protein
MGDSRAGGSRNSHGAVDCDRAGGTVSPGDCVVSYTISPLGRPNSDIRVAWSDSPTGAVGSWNDTVANDVTTNSQFHPWVGPIRCPVCLMSASSTAAHSATNITAERFMTASIDGGREPGCRTSKSSDAPSNQSAGNPNRDAGNNFGDYNANVAMFAWASTPGRTTPTRPATTPVAPRTWTSTPIASSWVATSSPSPARAPNDTYTVKMDSSGTFLQIWENTAPVGIPTSPCSEDAIDGIHLQPRRRAGRRQHPAPGRFDARVDQCQAATT